MKYARLSSVTNQFLALGFLWNFLFFEYHKDVDPCGSSAVNMQHCFADHLVGTGRSWKLKTLIYWWSHELRIRCRPKSWRRMSHRARAATAHFELYSSCLTQAVYSLGYSTSMQFLLTRWITELSSGKRSGYLSFVSGAYPSIAFCLKH